MGLAPKQLEYFKALVNGRYEYLLYGGGVAGGKTILVLGILDEFSQQFPGTRFAVIRKSLTTLRRNTIPSFRKVLQMNGDPDRAKLHKGEWTYFYKNGSEIIFMEADVSTDADLNKLRGLEVTGCALEEANEMSFDVFNVMITRIGRWYNDEFGIKQFILLTCNPDVNWVKTEFYDKYKRGELEAPYYFLEALPHDNPHNTKAFLDGLENLPEAEYQKYVKGNWDFAGDPNQLVPFLWYKNVIEDPEYTRIPKYCGVDVAREGDDTSTLVFYDDIGMISIESYKFDTCNPLRDIIMQRAEEYGMSGEDFMCDGIGLGASLIDLCADKGFYIEVFKSSERALGFDVGLENFTFRNKRAEAHWLYRLSIQNGNVTVLNNYELQKQTMVLKYEETSKCISIEDKKIIKKRLGYSPDVAEAAIIGNYLRVSRGNSYLVASKNEGSDITPITVTIFADLGYEENCTMTYKELVY